MGGPVLIGGLLCQPDHQLYSPPGRRSVPGLHGLDSTGKWQRNKAVIPGVSTGKTALLYCGVQSWPAAPFND